MHNSTCVTHVPWCKQWSLNSGFLWSQWRGKRSRHSRRMRNPQFYVSGKRPMEYGHAFVVICFVSCYVISSCEFSMNIYLYFSGIRPWHGGNTSEIIQMDNNKYWYLATIKTKSQHCTNRVYNYWDTLQISLLKHSISMAQCKTAISPVR